MEETDRKRKKAEVPNDRATYPDPWPPTRGGRMEI